MFRKRRIPAPNFRTPSQPFNPITGKNASLEQIPGKGTTLAMFQVIEDDTHDNYVVCRGYEADNDPDFRYLHDPYTVPATTPINVAKPYSVRGTFPYELGQVIVAARIKGRLGYNQGKGVTVGQPADLDEEIALLLDDDDVSIAWMDVGTSPSAEQSLLVWDLQTTGISGTEISVANPAVIQGQIDGTTRVLVPQTQPVTGWVKLFRADKALRLHFNANGEVNKEFSGAGTAVLALSLKKFNSSDALQATITRTVSVPSSSASDVANLSCQYYLTMATGDYLVATVAMSGTYASTIRLNNFGMYFRPIRNL